MNDNMVVVKSNTWGNFSNIRNPQKRIRLMKKYRILGKYPFIDHYNIYAYKMKHQKGKAKEEQTFLISYAYNYDAFANETQFVNEINEIGLCFYKENCIYNNKNAYKIIIYEPLCPIETIKLFDDKKLNL